MTAVADREAVGLAPRVDGVDKVTGAARYAGDLTRPGMLWGKVLRSPYPHARIVSIDTSAALAVPGVHAVLTGADIPPEVRVGRNMRDMPVLARDKVRFIGEKVAAVAAETTEIAEAAVRLIEVEYEDLPAVFDPLEAIKPGAPLVHDPETVRAWAAREQVVPDYPNGASAPSWGASLEEVERALEGADDVFEHTFHTPRQHQVYLEPHVCMVELVDGVAHIWASNKAPLLLARYLKEGLGLGRDQINLHLLPLGGDFGGKGSFMDIPLAYYLARATGRPVKIPMTYAEEMAAANPRHASTMVVRSGVNRDGRIVAQWVRGYLNSGAYAAFKPSEDTTLPAFKRGAVGPYGVPVHRAECHMIYTNCVPGGHMRSPGEAQTTYALELHLELIARELGLDPVEFRRMNGSHHPRTSEIDGSPIPPRVDEVLDVAVQAIRLREPRPEGVGRGFALVEFRISPGLYAGILRIARDGRITVQTPMVENGAGALTSFKQVVAEELGVPVDQVDVVQSVEGIEDDRGVGGSRVTRLAGKLLIELSHRLRDRLAGLLASELGLERSALENRPGGFTGPDGRFHSFAAAAALSPEPVSEYYVYRPNRKDLLAVYQVQAAEVHVDRETGRISPLRMVSVHEVGRVINPLQFERQVDGGVVQGLGFALMEGLNVEDGRVTNVNLHEYKIPTEEDLPPLQTIFLEPDPGLGITPIGEGPNAGMSPAFAIAVVDAVGPYAFDLPLSPDVVRRVASGELTYKSARVR